MNNVTRQARWLIGASSIAMAMSVNAAELVEMTDATKAQTLIDAQFSIVLKPMLTRRSNALLCQMARLR